MAVVRRHWLVSLVILALVVAGGAGAWLKLRPAAAASPTLTATVQTTTFSTTVSADGTVTPARESDLSFPPGGSVTSVLVAEGDKVTKGHVLARMDSAALRAQRDAAQATLDAAESQLSSDENADASSTQIAADEAQIASARSSLTSAQDDVDGATLTAPFSGTVSAVGVAVGDSTGTGQTGQASAAETSTSSTAAVSVISTSSYVVDATVGASDVAQLKKGLQARITPTGSSTTVYGVVESVGVIAQQSQSGQSGSTSGSSGTSASFPVTIRVTGSTAGLYAGSSASVSIIVKQVSDVLAVPTQAISSSGGKTYVKKVVDGKAVRTAVTLGQAYGAQTEVKLGLKAGDTVQLAAFAPPGANGTRSGRTGQNGGFPGGAGGEQGGQGGGQGNGGLPGGFGGPGQ